jgi:hypothetical protein
VAALKFDISSQSFRPFAAFNLYWAIRSGAEIANIAMGFDMINLIAFTAETAVSGGRPS